MQDIVSNHKPSRMAKRRYSRVSEQEVEQILAVSGLRIQTVCHTFWSRFLAAARAQVAIFQEFPREQPHQAK
jgi:hypothetical protein